MSLADKLLDQNLVQLGQSGVIAQNNFITFGKILELDYVQGEKMVSLPEALGAREVGSKQVPAGPTSV